MKPSTSVPSVAEDMPVSQIWWGLCTALLVFKRHIDEVLVHACCIDVLGKYVCRIICSGDFYQMEVAGPYFIMHP